MDAPDEYGSFGIDVLQLCSKLSLESASAIIHKACLYYREL